jgi:ABC-type sugar transport system substrate-binding protein
MRPSAFLAAIVAVLAAAALAVAARADATGLSWGPETPNFNLEVILRPADGGSGFGHVKFRQPNDADKVVYLDTWVRDLAPNHSYLLRRAVDPMNVVDGNCDSSAWVTLGEGTTLPPKAILTDDRGTGSAALYRILPSPVGTTFDIHFQVVDAANIADVVLESGCYQYTVSL